MLLTVTRLELSGRDAVGIRADNPSPFSLSGTNTWIVGHGPAWVVDPGPPLESHLAAVMQEAGRRGGIGGIALTHDHFDHSEGVPALLERAGPVPVGAARGDVDVLLADGDRFGPLEALATPGHAPDHLAYLYGDLALSGDAVLGEGSVFIAPDPGALAGYLAGLERLRDRRPAMIGPGHGPVIEDPEAKLAEYIAHRLERERRLVAALEAGRRTIDELLDAVWTDAPAILRPAAEVTLAAHLDKLEDEGRLPEGVQRPAGWGRLQA
jgi:glyoxylase-like metal-dependent hydrolase (beta-lactamase superfamily II)